MYYLTQGNRSIIQNSTDIFLPEGYSTPQRDRERMLTLFTNQRRVTRQ